MKNTLIKTALALLLSLFFTWVYLFTPQTFYSLDNKLRDMMFVVRGELPKNDNVVIIDIDNKSLHEIGQWPWPRNKIAMLLDTLTQAGAGIIGLDMVFSEEDQSSPHRLAKQYPNITQKLENYDAILAKTLSRSPVVGGYVFTDEKTKEANTPLIPAVFIQQGVAQSHYITEPSGILLNIPVLQEAFYSTAFFSTSTDEGAIIRNTPLVKRYKGDMYSSLALEMVRIYSGSKNVNIVGDKYGIDHITFGQFNIPTNHMGELMVNYRGKEKHFPYISASDILDGHFNPKAVSGKFVLLGTSAAGLKDLRATPLDTVYPGVEVHANIIDNILTGDFLHKPFIAQLYDIGIIWGIVFVGMLLFSIASSQLVIPLSLVMLTLLFYILYTILFSFGLVLGIFIPLLALISTLITSISIDYILTSKQKEAAKRMLGKKVSPSVMDYLLAHAEEDLVSPKELEATIFFSDIRDFTTISEKMGSPNKLISMLNTYMTPMVDTIVEHKGTIDKFIGDAIMAYWNAPIETDNHADKAVQAAIKQINLLETVNQVIQKKYDVTLHIGIGLHTGQVTAGDMGSEGRSDYTVIGDNVNLASRIEGLTKQYDVKILISEATRKQLKQSYTIRPIDIVEVKGKSKPVEIYEVICGKQTISNEELSLYLKAIETFRQANVTEAHKFFTQLHMHSPSKLYKMYQTRCKVFMENPHTFTPVLKINTK